MSKKDAVTKDYSALDKEAVEVINTVTNSKMKFEEKQTGSQSDSLFPCRQRSSRLWVISGIPRYRLLPPSGSPRNLSKILQASPASSGSSISQNIRSNGSVPEKRALIHPPLRK